MTTGTEERTYSQSEVDSILRAAFPAVPQDIQRSLADELGEAENVIRDLLAQWPEGSCPSGPLTVRAAKIINARTTIRAEQFRVDLDDRGELDDLAISNPELVRLERMGGNSFWGRITMPDGREVELSFYTARTLINASAEVSPPPPVTPEKLG